MIKSNREDKAFSFVMGIDNDFNKELDIINASYEIENDKYYLVSIPKENIANYEKIIMQYLKPGFWNEYISDDVVFIFKTKENEIRRYKWDEDNEKEILKLCNEFASLNEASIESMLLNVEFYKQNSLRI
jgi:hypothetical protein